MLDVLTGSAFEGDKIVMSFAVFKVVYFSSGIVILERTCLWSMWHFLGDSISRFYIAKFARGCKNLINEIMFTYYFFFQVFNTNFTISTFISVFKMVSIFRLSNVILSNIIKLLGVSVIMLTSGVRTSAVASVSFAGNNREEVSQ